MIKNNWKLYLFKIKLIYVIKFHNKKKKLKKTLKAQKIIKKYEKLEKNEKLLIYKFADL